MPITGLCSHSLPAPALVLDEQGLVVDANELALGLLRRPRAELLRWTVADVVEGARPTARRSG